MDNYDHVVKLILAGDSNVGKTCIVNMFCDHQYLDYDLATTGVEFCVKIITLDDRKIKLQIWDTSGQERFKSITTPYFRNAHGIILVFDLTNRKSFQNLEKWLNEIVFLMSDSNYKIILAGNKSDDKFNRHVFDHEIKNFSERNKLPYIEVSARQNVRIEELFETITTDILNSNIPTRKTSRQSIHQISKYTCCVLL